MDLITFARNGKPITYPLADNEYNKLKKLLDIKTKTEQPKLQHSYFDIRDLAWTILIESKIDKLPIELNKITKMLGYKIVKYSNTEVLTALDKFSQHNEKEAFCTEINGVGIICYNDNYWHKSRIRFTMAHEIGHIALHHAKITMPDYEQEANMFGRRLLCPMGLLKACDVRSTQEVQSLCDISFDAAVWCYKRYKILLDRDKFFTSPLERELINQFMPFIKHYRKLNSRGAFSL